MQSHRFFQSEQEVHVVDGLSAGTFQQIINHGDNQQFVFILLQVNEALVGIDHLLQIRILVYDERKRMVVIIFLVDALDFAQLNFAIQISGSKDAARKVAPHRNEVNLAREAVLQLHQALVDFSQMLVRERLVD